VTVFSVEPTEGSDRRFTVTFDPQTSLGDYFLTISSHVSDLAGNELDQDGDGVGGVEGLDEWTGTFAISDSQALFFESPNVPVEIRRFDQFSSTLTINENIKILDLNVHLDLSFPRTGNLHVWLISPSGTLVTLTYRHGGDEANFADTIFDDEADASIAEGLAPFSGSFRPDDALGAFDDQDAFGTWQLVIQNVSEVRSRGTLNGWGLEILPGELGGGGPGPNDPPTPEDDAFITNQDEAIVISTAALLANDTDPNDDPLSFGQVINPIGGSVQQNADSTITFWPDLGSLAPGAFEYTVTDGLATSIARVVIAIKPNFNLHNGFDVNNDSYVAPNDALLVINYLNAFGSSPIIGLSTLYYDVIADNVIAPNDALAVINYLNANPAVRSLNWGGDGEAVLASASAEREGGVDAAAADLLLAAGEWMLGGGTARRARRG
jgi:subtilisin-like proprotein convertase family protein